MYERAAKAERAKTRSVSQKNSNDKSNCRAFSNPSNAIQKVESETVVTVDVAQKIFKNFTKGDFPFKPQHGTHGKVSWFKGTGKPYSGRLLEGNVLIPVNINDASKVDIKLQDIVAKHKDEDIRDRSVQARIWNEVGSEAENNHVSQIIVPRCELSQSGEGTFLTISSSGRTLVKLTNPEKLADDIGEGKAAEIVTAEAEKSKSKENGFSFSISATLESKPEVKKIQEVISRAMGGIQVQSGMLTRSSETPLFTKEKPANTMAESLQKDYKKFYFLFKLTFESYKAARLAAKLLSTNTNYVKGQIKDAEVTIIKGNNWSDTSIRSYNEKY